MTSVARPGHINVRSLLRRLVLIGLILLVGGYVLAVAGGYSFLRYSRELKDVSLADVALFRLKAIRRTQARENFRQAQVAWDAKDYQQAYVTFTSAVARDPDNLEGRLNAARFFAALGATNLEINLLEDGLLRHPESRELNERLFGRLLTLGRDRHVLELLHGSYAGALAGPNGAFLQVVELQATLAASGAPAAKALMDRNPQLRSSPLAGMVVARVLWESGDRPAAIQRLADQVKAEPGSLSLQMVLADWRRQNGEEQAAIDTALEAIRLFPTEPAARVLLLDVGSGRVRGKSEWWPEIGRYLKDFEASPKSIFVLAELGGRRGWIDLTGTLYELGARRGQDLGMLGLFHSDALGRNSRFTETRAILAEIELQSANRGQPFLLQLRQREIAAAAAVGDAEGVREFARRLAGLLRDDPDLLAQYRQLFVGAGVKEAVAELSERKPRAATPPVVRNGS